MTKPAMAGIRLTSISVNENDIMRTGPNPKGVSMKSSTPSLSPRPWIVMGIAVNSDVNPSVTARYNQSIDMSSDIARI